MSTAGSPAGSLFAVGDVQGCFDCLQTLLARLPADCPLWFTGDLVNRGPQSLETLRWARDNDHRLVTVLGNHDLHLLAVAAGIQKNHGLDTLEPVLAAPDLPELVDWLRRRPLAHLARGHLLVHAGVLPQWSASRTVALAAEVETVLRSPDWIDFLRVMYGNQPDRWDDALTGADRLRVIVNALTRLRFCTPQGQMEFQTKEGVGAALPGYRPWFDVDGRATRDVTVVFGHWAALGYIDRPDLLAIDTGCVWGRDLTAVRLSDRQVLSCSCAGVKTKANQPARAGAGPLQSGSVASPSSGA